jgi:hypothetical protein
MKLWKKTDEQDGIQCGAGRTLITRVVVMVCSSSGIRAFGLLTLHDVHGPAACGRFARFGAGVEVERLLS